MTPTIRSVTLPNIDPRNNRNEETGRLILDSSIVHVWSIEFHEHFHELFKRFRRQISPNEYDKAKRLHRANDIKRYLTGRIVLRILLGRYLPGNPSEILFRSDNGKLSVIGSPLKFNLSYSEKHIYISFGLCDTGIDIELIKPNFDFRDILSGCFSPTEIANISEENENLKDRFFLQWTRKEALLKYTGQGIIDDMTMVPSLDGVHNSVSSKLKIKSDLNLISFKPNINLVGSLAYPTNITTVEFINWQ